MYFLKESYKEMQKFKFWKVWEHPLYENREYVFSSDQKDI